MARARSSPGALRLAAAPLWSIPPGALGAGCVVALFFVPAHIRWPVAWFCAAAVALVALASAEAARRARSELAEHHAQSAAHLEQRHTTREADLRRRLADQHATTVWLADELLPAAVARMQRGETAAEILQSVPLALHLDAEFAAAHQAVLRTVLEAVQAEEDTRESAQRAFVNLARRVQAIVHQLVKDLDDMQIRHGNDPMVSADLQNIDHRTALIGRLAASIAVLGDARPGRQWSKNVSLYSVLRGAMSRIVDYPRVQLHSVTEVAVVGEAVEPLIHALAELLDNATHYSPPHTKVDLTASEVPSGIAIEIEDRGIGLTEETRLRNERVMSQAAAGIDLADLGETPRLGLPVVSRLARENGFVVDLRPSAYGGVRVVVLVPRRLITTVQQPTRKRVVAPSVPRPRPLPLPAEAPAEPAEASYTAETGQTANGLPQRRRRSAVPTPVVRTGSPAPAAPTGTPGRPPGLMWEQFQGDKPAEDSPSFPPSRTSEPSDKGE